MKHIKSVFLILLLNYSCFTYAYDKDGEYIPWGLGAAKCEIFIQHMKNDKDGKNQLIYMQWLNGYFTGVNAGKAGNADFSRKIDRSNLIFRITQHCETTPELTVEAIAYSLWHK